MRFGPGAVSLFIKVMLITNVGIFILQKMIGPQFTLWFGLIPQFFFAQFPNYIYQIFTYMFLHGDFWHLLFNMFMLWMFGTSVEHALGTRSFARLYFLSGIAGAILSLMTQAFFPTVAIVGASGAIYGILIAYWLKFPDRMLYIYFLFPVKVSNFVTGNTPKPGPKRRFA